MYPATIHDPGQAQLGPHRQTQGEALFASALQPSDAPTADMIAAAIARSVRRFGTGGCAGRMAQEFGDHPDAAAERMRWVHQLAAQASGTGTRPDGRDITTGPVAA